MNSCLSGHSAATQFSKQRPSRIDPIDETAHPTLAGYGVVKLRKSPQEGEMVLAPGDDIVEIVARSDGGAGHQQQDLMQWIEDPSGFARVIKLRKMLQKQAQTSPPDLLIQDRVGIDVHNRAPCRIRTPTESRTSRQYKITPLSPLT